MKCIHIFYKSLSRTKNLVLLLLIIFPFTFQSNLMAIDTSRFKKKVTREYNTCERKRIIIEKAVCMTILRSRLERNLEYDLERGYYYQSTYRSIYGSRDSTIRIFREFENYSIKELRRIHKRERQIVQEYIARLDRDRRERRYR